MTIIDNLDSMAQPAFASNYNGRIVAWNHGAAHLFGHATADMIGRHCFEVLDGKDIFGNRFCHERCAIRCMLRGGEPINHWQLNYRTASSERIDVSVSAIAVDGDTSMKSCIVHLLEPAENTGAVPGLDIPRKPGKNSPLDEPADAALKPVNLTARERQILRLLASGSTTSDIVGHLHISGDTVRTHVRNILRKIDAHSRLEAVSKAMRRRLL